jgi:hypothetical protein
MSGSPSIGVPPMRAMRQRRSLRPPLCGGSLPAAFLKRNLVARIGSLVNPWLDPSEELSEVSGLLRSAGNPTGRKVTRLPLIGLPGPTA